MGAGDTVFLAGATGWLGSYIAQELASRGYKVRALVRNPADAARFAGLPGCSAVAGDVTKPESLRGALDGCAAVVSALGMRGAPAGSYREAVVAVNRDGLKALCDEAISSGTCRRVVVVASTGSSRRSTLLASSREDAIDHIKARCEQQQQQARGSGGMGWTIVEPSAFFKDIDHIWERTSSSGKAMAFGSGLERRFNPISGEDLAARIVDCLRQEADRNARVPVGGPDVYTFREMYEMAGELAGVSVRFTSVPLLLVDVMLCLLRVLGLLSKRAERVASFLEFLRVISTQDSVGTPYGSRRLRPYMDQLAARARGGDGSGRA